jgi:hypothetical protein
MVSFDSDSSCGLGVSVAEVLAGLECLGLAVVCGPLDEVGVHEAPGGALGVDLHEHVGVGIVARGGHDIVLRAIGVGEVDPLVHVAGDDQLEWCPCICAAAGIAGHSRRTRSACPGSAGSG